MRQTPNQFKERLFDVIFAEINPYNAIDSDAFPHDDKGWGGEDPFLEKVILTVRPKTILEIGTWKGASAMYMARCVRNAGLTTEIICADPHTASSGYWINSPHDMHMTATGDCGTYEIFLANVKRAELMDIITPFRATSSVATAVLSKTKIKADIVYIDGSHNPVDVAADLHHIMRVIHDDTIIICDDYDHPGIRGVNVAVKKFLAERDDYAIAAISVNPTQGNEEKMLGVDRGMDSKIALVKKNSRYLRKL